MMKRPSHQAKLLCFGLLRTASALASTEQRVAAAAAAASSSLASGCATAAAPGGWAVHSHQVRQQRAAPAPLTLRRARRSDVPALARCNLETLPENYNHDFYRQHMHQWPELALVAVLEDAGPKHSPPHAGYQPVVVRQQQQKRRRTFWSSSPEYYEEEEEEEEQDENYVVAYVLGKVEERAATTAFVEEDEGGRCHRPTSTAAGLGGTLAGIIPTGTPSARRRLARRKERVGHVTSLAVRESFRRQGLAAALLEQLHHHMSVDYGADCVGLHVRQSNAAAVNLYGRRFGYDTVDTIGGYYQDGEDAYYMQKPLPQQQSFLFGGYRPAPDLRLPRHLERRPPKERAVQEEEEEVPELLTGTL
jgi:ribosomal protein S18 acetylase RimI-like enzyme